METVTIDSLHEDLTFTGDLLIDSTFVLLPQTANVTKELIAALKEWEFDSVLCDGNLSLGGDIGVTTNTTNPDENEVKSSSGSDNIMMGESVRKALEVSKTSLLDNSDKTRMQMVQKVYDEYMNYIEQVFTHYTTHKQINQDELADTVKELCVFTKDNKRFILRVNPSDENSDKNFLIRHSMRTTVLAIVIALQLRMPLSKMIDLGVTCIIHEIGMLRLPPQIYMSNRKLTPGEKAQIAKHPILGYSIAKDLTFPSIIQLGILEHHEKENGTGYPRKLTSDKISLNAKIISVACSYEAITSPRSYKDEHTQFEAIIELLRNENKPYDDQVIRALLISVSLYPIGTYVYLSDRKVGQVIDTNPDNPKCPVVQYLTEKDKDGSPKVIQTLGSDIKILRILSKKEQEDIVSFVKQKASLEAEAHAQVEAQNRLNEQNNNHVDSSANETTTENIQTNQNNQTENVQQIQTNNESAASVNTDNNSIASSNSVQQNANINAAPKIDKDGMEEVDISLFS